MLAFPTGVKKLAPNELRMLFSNLLTWSINSYTLLKSSFRNIHDVFNLDGILCHEMCQRICLVNCTAYQTIGFAEVVDIPERTSNKTLISY